MLRPDSLWDQYLGKALAEASRGCGLWPLQPHPCELEPPFEPFDRRSVTIWDCMVNDWEGPWEGSFLGKAFSPPPVYEQGRPVVLPERPSLHTEDLVPVTIEQFSEDESTIAKAEELLRSLPHVSRPVSFEVLGVGRQPQYDVEKSKQILQERAAGTSQRPFSDAICGWDDPYTRIQFIAHRRDAGRLERQLLAHYPNSAVVAGEELSYGEDSLVGSDVQHGDGFANVLGLNHEYCWPVRTFGRLDPDPLGVAIAAMEDVGKHEWALLQILFQPAEHAWADNVREALTDPYKGHYLDEDLSDRTLREKFSGPLFAVSVRILARREDAFRQLQGWAEQFANPPQSFDFLLEDDEAASLSLAVEQRCTFRPGILLNAQELASLIHLPAPSVVSERLRRVKRRTRAAEETDAKPGSVLLGENVHRGRKRKVRVPAKLRERHCYIAGASGTGKSTLLLNMIMQDIQGGHGVGVLDPHGDLVNAVLRRIPEERIEDVVLFDPADEEYPFALNILDARDEHEQKRIVDETLMALERYFPASWGPRLERILTFTLYTVLDAIEHPTLADVERMLIDDAFRDSVVNKTKTPRFRQFWQHEMPKLPKNAVDPVLNKLSVFLLNPTVRNIICQRRSAVDFDKLLNGRQILLANLSTGLLNEKIAGTLGSFLVTKIVNAAFRRARVTEKKRRTFYLYVDEFQNFMNVSVGFDRILAEARKYKLVLAGLANQYVGQLTPAVRQAVFGNVGTFVTFRLGIDDARIVSKELGMFTEEEILSLDVGEAIARAGGSDKAFNLRTFPEPHAAERNSAPRIRSRSREKYAQTQSQAEIDIARDVDGMVQTVAPECTVDPATSGDQPADPLEDDLVS